MRLCGLRGEVFRELQDFTGPVAQRRHLQLDHVEAIVKILAEALFLDQLLEMLIGRGNDARIDFDRLRTADALERPLLQKAQQLRLHHRRQIANLVEQDRAALGRFEAAGLVLDGAGERTAHVPEEFALEQMLAQRRARDLHERAVLARTQAMDVRRQHALAGAAFAGDQRGRVAVSHLRGDLRKFSRMRTVGEKRFGLDETLDPIAQLLVLGAQLVNFQRARDDVHDVVGGERLGDVVVGPQAHRLDRVGNRAVGGHHHYWHRGIEALDRFEQLQAAHPFHPNVGDDDRGHRRSEQFERSLGIFRDRHLMMSGFQAGREHATDIAVVVDDKNVSQVRPRFAVRLSY